MIPQNCNGMVQTVIDTVKSVQLKMKSKLPMMTDEAREKQIPPNDQLQNGSPCISTGGTESNNTDSTSKPGFQSSETQSMVFIRTTTSEFSLSTHTNICKREKTRFFFCRRCKKIREVFLRWYFFKNEPLIS